MIEYQGEVLPIEVKSGKDYTRHRALDHVLQNEAYGIRQAIVFSDENIQVKDNVFYCPVYLVGMFKKQVEEEDLIYQLDLGILQ